MNRIFHFLATVIPAVALCASPADELRTGLAQHAFDHLGNAGNLADTAAACGETIIYCNGIGPGYMGLPDEKTLAADRAQSLAYLKDARRRGIRVAIGYVCATSIVHLDTFDKNWTPEFRAQFGAPPSHWLQVDRNGHPLPSWYGAPYEPACMNNPDWRTYERFMVRQQLEAGCDGIFFDNPTVHPNGCYCPFCMEKFDAFLAAKHDAPRPSDHSLTALRQWAATHSSEFLEFRSLIAPDFLNDMRHYARSIKHGALVTCNNSLNSPGVLFSQCRADGYNINAMSQAEDFVLVEDMASQTRRAPDGRIFEYSPTYKTLHAIAHGKPVVACTVAEADYHTSANLARLSMAEAAANDATWMLWPAWPGNMRPAMESNIFPEANFLRRNQKLLNNTRLRADVVLLLDFQRWLATEHCAISPAAARLTKANIQYAICSPEDLPRAGSAPVLLIESFAALTGAERKEIEIFSETGGKIITLDQKDWFDQTVAAIPQRSILVTSATPVRAIVRDQRHRAIVHLYNLGVTRLSSFADKVTPARNITLSLRVPFRHVRSVTAFTADKDSASGGIPFRERAEAGESIIDLTYPRLAISTILVVKP